MSSAPDDEYREGYQKIKGRWWRSSDPRIPATLRQELVNELMSARRAVAGAGKSDNDDAMAAARFRVNNAKQALGERGHKWWLAANTHQLQMRILATLCALLHHRSQTSICPSEVARISTGDQWRDHMGTVREVACRMTALGFADITQKGQSVQPPFKGPIRIQRGPQFSNMTRKSQKQVLSSDDDSST